MARFFHFFFVLLLLFSCGGTPKEEQKDNGAFAKTKKTEDVNVSRIVESGELIVATISSPETYFEYQGVGMGLQYALAADFAATLGVGVRVELANDTTSLLRLLNTGDADLIALQLPDTYIKGEGMLAAGAMDKQAHTAWAVRKDAGDLADALGEWYDDGVKTSVEKKENKRYRERRQVRRSVRAPYISHEKGIISTYDNYFKEAAHATGWDWRLIAAQCYQESGFDPNAVSWAGARGLMQIMPSTARHLGLAEEKTFSPADNIAAASRLIRELQGHFYDVTNVEERVKFVLAAYNGGAAHIRDAQALARKYGGNPYQWDDVSFYVRGLSNPKYYRDPVVKHGYMIGSETAGYVESIIERWKAYGGDVRSISSPSGMPISPPAASVRTGEGRPSGHKRNRFTKEQKILTPEELQRLQ